MSTNPERLTELRKYLHQHPEVSNEESKTSTYMKQRLHSLENLSEIVDVGKYGFVAVFRGQDPDGERIMLRCELDALPIQEVNEFDHRSETEGVSHKCGHDGHMTMLYGVAEWLNEHQIEKGQVFLLFQAAEETGDGAVEAIAHPNFQRLAPDRVYALHNLPGKEMHEVFVKEGVITPSVKSLIFRYRGKTSHAAEPENGYNPALALAQSINLCEEMTLNDPTRDDFFLITNVYATLGDKAYGISAGYAELHLTIRSWDEQLFQNKCDQLIKEVRTICEKQQLECDTEWCFEFQANVNDRDAVVSIETACKRSNVRFNRLSEPFKFGEDFGVFTQKYQGAMFGLGSGLDTPALHNPDYDFPDELTPTGIQLFTEILKNHLHFV